MEDLNVHISMNIQNNKLIDFIQNTAVLICF